MSLVAKAPGMRRLATLMVIGVLAVPVLAGCAEAETTAEVSQTTMLQRALSRVTLGDESNLSVTFDNSAALAELLGDEVSMEPPSFGLLAGMGAGSIAMYQDDNDALGIDLAAADFAISVGQPPFEYTLVAGGQNVEVIEERLSEQGWVAEGDQLMAPPHLGEGAPDAQYHALAMWQVTGMGSDLLFGREKADLSLVDSSSALIGDERVAQVADCLGEVAAAMINTVELREASPMVGIGVRVPADSGERPQVVVCTSWEGDAQASAYADRARSDLLDGMSMSGKPYSEIFDAPEAVASTGSLASWESGTDSAMTVFATWVNGGLPGIIIACERLTSEQLAVVGDSC